MSTLQPSKFNQARGAYLPGLLRGMGIELKKQGSKMSSNYCPVCGTGHDDSNRVSIFLSEGGIWRFKCFSCGIPAASAIDFVAAHMKVTDREAVDIIVDSGEIQTPVPAAKASSKEETSEALRNAIKVISDRADATLAVNYLVGRGIAQSVAELAAERGLVKSLPGDPAMAEKWLRNHVGYEGMLESGLLKPGKRMSACAFRPVVFPLGVDSAEFRLDHKEAKGEIKSIRYGHMKRPFWWKGENEKHVLITEGMIDMLSAVSMGWKGHIMGIPGATTWRMEWFAALQAKYPGIKFWIGFDRDGAGETASRKIATLLYDAEGDYTYQIVTPPEGCKDWNDALAKGMTFKDCIP